MSDDVLHFNFPGPLVNGLVGAAAMAAAMGVYLGRRLPDDVAIMGEVDAAEKVVGYVGSMRTSGGTGDAETLLRLAYWNRVKRIVVPNTQSGRDLADIHRKGQRRVKVYRHVQVLLVDTVVQLGDIIFSLPSQPCSDKEDGP